MDPQIPSPSCFGKHLSFEWCMMGTRAQEEVITAMQQRRTKVFVKSPTAFSREGDDWKLFLRLRRGIPLCLTGVAEHTKFSYLFKGFVEGEKARQKAKYKKAVRLASRAPI